VTIRTTKAPLADTEIYLTPASEKEKDPDMTPDAIPVAKTGDARVRRRTTTDAQGRFRLLHVPAVIHGLGGLPRPSQRSRPGLGLRGKDR
jgi:hypothetical protein